MIDVIVVQLVIVDVTGEDTIGGEGAGDEANWGDVMLEGDWRGDSSGANDDETDDGVAVALSANEPVLPDEVVPSSMVMNLASFWVVSGESNHLSTLSTACGFCFCSTLLMFEFCNNRDQESGMPVNSPVTASKPTWTVCSKLLGGETTRS